MQSSRRAARDSRREGQETAELGGQSPVERGWFQGLARLFGSKPSPQKAGETNTNALLAFPSEAVSRPEPASIADVAKRVGHKVAPPAKTEVAPPAKTATALPKLPRAMLIAGAVVGLAGLIVLAIQLYPILQVTTKAPQPGTLTINTRPSDAEVLIDGTRRGTTPLTLPLTPGTHTMTVRSGGDERVVPLKIASGAEVNHYFEMKAVEPAVVVGRV